MSTIPSDRQPKAAVVAARKQRAMNEFLAARNLDRDATTQEVLAADPDHPLSEEDAIIAREAANDSKATAIELLSGVGQTESDAIRSIKQARLDELKDQISRWTVERDILQDYAENPDIWGGRTLGGDPIDVDVCARQVKEFDAALTAAKNELSNLKA